MFEVCQNFPTNFKVSDKHCLPLCVTVCTGRPHWNIFFFFVKAEKHKKY